MTLLFTSLFSSEAMAAPPLPPEPPASDNPLFVECFDPETFADNFGYVGGTVAANSSWGHDSQNGPYIGSGSAGRLTTATASRGTLAHNDAFTGFAGEFTIDCWNYRGGDSTGNRGIFSKWSATTGNRAWAIRYNNRKLGALLSLDGTAETLLEESISTPQSVWHHIALDRDAANVVRLYRDGIVVASTTLSGTICNNIGISVEFNGFNGGNSQSGDRSAQYRITRNAALYAGAYTPPTARLARPQ